MRYPYMRLLSLSLSSSEISAAQPFRGRRKDQESALGDREASPSARSAPSKLGSIQDRRTFRQER
ncbi:hypothetical protein BDA96_01G222200 [Sorghum bicolor]|uniref:Uncharacterized protein n=2 Tax=Sorghum bicolor TaxID=4558 RepID=A0A921S0K2_SORBI|nr:hypothetical protein BDA96_01G222200 [Sorghum bicolor]KXG38266.2 hypothetical protein SORBI_3001G208401 [Sorghum bicolor]